MIEFTHSRTISVAAIVMLLFSALVAVADEQTLQKKLFEIERSKNRNVVRYDVRVKPDGRADEEKPVLGYWINKEEPGEPEEPLSWFEGPAYGFAATYDADNDVIRIDMNPDIGRDIWAMKVDGEYRARTTIDGRSSYLSRIYVLAKPRRFVRIPKVVHIEFKGIDIETGKENKEIFVPE